MGTIFSKIIAHEIPAEILHEDDLCLAFRDINPKAPTHFLVIPKKEIVSLAELSEEDEDDHGPLHHGCIPGGRRRRTWTAVTEWSPILRDDGGQEVPHLHFHVLGGRKMTWPPG